MAVTYSDKGTFAVESGGSLAEGAGGIAVAVLAIIGLSQTFASGMLASIAVIILGAALFVEGGALAAELSRLMKMETGGAVGRIDIGSGMTLELFGGVALIALGVLAVLNIVPATLIAVAVIAAGAILVLSSGTLFELSEFRMRTAAEAGVSEPHRNLMKAGISSAVGVQVLAGGAGVVLGILALGGTAAALTLSQIGLLVLGSAVAVSAGTMTGSLARMFSHAR